MNRLQTELHRLYISPAAESKGQDPLCADINLIDVNGRVRAMVLEVAQPAGWDGVAALWQGMQDELGMPAAAIAVSGVDSYQVWLSLAEPVLVAQAIDFLESLRLRYLSDIAQRHIRMKPCVDPSAPAQALHARMVPSVQTGTGRWSSFIAPGLAGMFAQEPWLDLQPGLDAQANLLSSLVCIKPADFRRVQDQLRSSGVADTQLQLKAATEQTESDPKLFLISVMNDASIELHLRIEAAKALLPFSG